MTSIISIISAMMFSTRVDVVVLTLCIASFLTILNIGLAIISHKKPLGEILSYYVVCGIELAIFLFALLLQLRILSHIPYPLPPGLPFNRAEIGATVAVGVGLLPGAYWRRMPFSELRKRIAQDAHVMKNHDVHVRESQPGEWMN